MDRVLCTGAGPVPSLASDTPSASTGATTRAQTLRFSLSVKWRLKYLGGRPGVEGRAHIYKSFFRCLLLVRDQAARSWLFLQVVTVVRSYVVDRGL